MLNLLNKIVSKVILDFNLLIIKELGTCVFRTHTARRIRKNFVEIICLTIIFYNFSVVSLMIFLFV